MATYDDDLQVIIEPVETTGLAKDRIREVVVATTGSWPSWTRRIRPHW